ncbi:MAG: sulfatase-like hydrolase/transferase, partial [Chitinophagales bacterium]|nr:sulfatase-like hydrolase/transferase [Chitinophagales bacterium]
MIKMLPLLFWISAFSFSAFAQCPLSKPQNLQVIKITSCDAKLKWSGVNNAAYYILRYKKETGTWTFINVGQNTSATVSGLVPNKEYSFSVASFCANNSTKGYSTPVLGLTASCTEPYYATATNINIHGATIAWESSCVTSFNLHYRKSGSTTWISVYNITDLNKELTSLAANTIYEYQVQSKCGKTTSEWTSIQTFQTLTTQVTSKPNILAIMVDDGRYDIYENTGGPSWFHTPAINRIADEGVNFQITCPSTSQCGPSRASFYTGLYGHNNGCTVNNASINNSIPLIQEILQQQGYYTGFVGKYGQGFGDPVGFDWWVTSEEDAYVDAAYQINGVLTFLPGHITDVYPQLALEFLNQVPQGQPFALFYFHRAPHGPIIPREEDENLYINKKMPFPSNFYKYVHDYPSYYYTSNRFWPYDSTKTDSLILLEFQSIAGVEDNVDTLMDWLESNSILDSTLILYTSDNGYMKGEHRLRSKGMALEESIRVPLFIRYPKWFPANTTITNEIASSIDIAPTFLELAGIPNTYNMDGLSLHKLAKHQVSRKDFLYEFGGEELMPPLRAVRSLQYKYIDSYCNMPTEEFYDLLNDPKENENLIGNSSYSAIIQQYRNKLDSLRMAFNDQNPEYISCYLANPTFKKAQEEDSKLIDNNSRLVIMPDPASAYFSIQLVSKEDG